MATKSAAFRDLDDAGLVQALSDAKEELFNLRFQNATGQLDNIARIPQVRREVARIETLLREREITAAEQLEALKQSALGKFDQIAQQFDKMRKAAARKAG